MIKAKLVGRRTVGQANVGAKIPKKYLRNPWKLEIQMRGRALDVLPFQRIQDPSGLRQGTKAELRRSQFEQFVKYLTNVALSVDQDNTLQLTQFYRLDTI